jgi:hypothetical protein
MFTRIQQVEPAADIVIPDSAYLILCNRGVFPKVISHFEPDVMFANG